MPTRNKPFSFSKGQWGNQKRALEARFIICPLAFELLKSLILFMDCSVFIIVFILMKSLVKYLEY
jgi:hypothetical protein